MKTGMPAWKVSLLASDALAIVAGFMLAYWLRFGSGLITAPKGVPPLSQHGGFMLFVLVVWLALFRWFGLYRQRTQSPLDEAYGIVVSVSAGSIALLGAVYWQQAYWYSRGLLILAVGLTASFMLAGRLVLRALWQAHYARGDQQLRVVLVGEEADCARVARSLAPLWTGYLVCGFIRPRHLFGEGRAAPRDAAVGRDAAAGRDSVEPPESIDGLPSEIRGLDTFRALVAGSSNHATVVNEVILIGNCMRGHEVQRLTEECTAAGVVLRAVPDVLDIVKRQSPVEEIAGVPLLTLSTLPMSLPGRFAKRALDLTLSLPLLAILAPLLAIVSALIKLNSRGPVFYMQERCGRDGHRFGMLKFRSMRADAEKDGARWATRNDDRVTPIGRWLRRTSLDELPQLFNVLRGDMSLVGPRPERPMFVEQFGQEIPRYHERHRMPVGITGWAQVNGLRGNTPIRDRTLYDLYYVENWSVALDLKILLKTVCEVLFHREAY